MDDNKSSLFKPDLQKKLDGLLSIYDHSAYHLSEYFFDVRSQIDYDVEKLAYCREDPSDETTNLVYDMREEFLRVLKHEEERTLKQLPAKSRPAKEEYATLAQKVDQFEASPGCADQYAQLALKILDEKNQLASRLFGGQTIFYLSSTQEDSLGNLIHLTCDRLSKDEINCVR